MGRYTKELSEILRYKELLRNLVTRDIKVRYKRSVLGFLWVMLNPLLMMIVISTVFSGIFKNRTPSYTSYLLSGIILWNFFSQSTSTAVVSMISNSGLIKKIYLPKAIFPLSVVLSAIVNFLFSLVPLFLIIYFTGTPLGSRIYLLPVILLLVGVFSYGIALSLSTLTVFFHDTIYIYDVLLVVWMYVTPIFYPESIISPRFLTIFHLNPFYYYVGIFRASLYLDVPLVTEKILYGFLYSIASLTIGWLLYSVNKDKIIYHL